MSNQYHSSERDLNLGLSGFAVFEDCKVNALTTQPPGRLVYLFCYYNHFFPPERKLFDYLINFFYRSKWLLVVLPSSCNASISNVLSIFLEQEINGFPSKSTFVWVLSSFWFYLTTKSCQKYYPVCWHTMKQMCWGSVNIVYSHPQDHCYFRNELVAPQDTRNLFLLCDHRVNQGPLM